MKCKDCSYWKKGVFKADHKGLDHICTNPRKKVKKGCVLMTDADCGCKLGRRNEENNK